MKTQFNEAYQSECEEELKQIERSIPGFRLFMNDRGKARPFARKINKVENLMCEDNKYYSMTLNTKTVDSNTQEWRRFATVSQIQIEGIDEYLKGRDIGLDPTMCATHILRREYLPLILTDHCMIQHSKRTGGKARELIENAYTLQTLSDFADEFWIRGKPISPNCGIKTTGGILLGEWAQPEDIDDDFELMDPFHIIWNHKRGHKNPSQFDRYTKFYPNLKVDRSMVFLAKTFITDGQASVEQLLQAKSYKDSDQARQRFRREGHREVWLNQ